MVRRTISRAVLVGTAATVAALGTLFVMRSFGDDHPAAVVTGSGFSAATLDEVAVSSNALIEGSVIARGRKADYPNKDVPFATQFYSFRIDRVIAQNGGPELRPGQVITVGMKAMSDSRTAANVDALRTEVATVSRDLAPGDRYVAFIAPEHASTNWGVVSSNWGLMVREERGLRALAPSGPLKGAIVSEAQIASAVGVLGSQPPVSGTDPYPTIVDGQAPVPRP
ncbi:MAG: hypothetical protein U0547_05650 [Dehalococcoidia bacterium]